MTLALRNNLWNFIKNSTHRVGARWLAATRMNSQKAVENLQSNPYYEKYANRIAELQQTSPEEFMDRVEQTQLAKEQDKKKKFASVDTSKFSSVLNPKEALKDGALAQDKKLDDIFKTDLVIGKDAAEIATIWQQYHINKEVISATITPELYTTIEQKMKSYPTFLFPLPRSEGYEFIMCQNHGNTVHFTPLLAYQVHKENAPECLTMVHYTELSDQGIVLMRGEYDKNVLNGKEAQCIANQFQMYYSGRDEKKQQLLETFTKHPNTFKHMDLIEQLENIGIP